MRNGDGAGNASASFRSMTTARSLVAAGTLLSLYACSSDKPSWRTTLATMNEGGALYSLSFNAPPPDGVLTRAIVLNGKTADQACGAFRDLSLPADYWYLAVEATGATPGSYPVVLHNESSSRVATATVSLVHVVSGEKAEVHRARAGALDLVTLSSDVSAWPGAQDLSGHLEATFSSSGWARGMCRWGQAVGAAPMQSCDCTGPGGEVRTCEVVDGVDDCCDHIEDGTDVPFAMDLGAKPCPWLCIFSSPDLAGYCIDLRE